MDILVPLPDFVDSSAVFSDDDLRKQVINISHAMDARHEVKFITLNNNPWVEMWAGHEVMLCEYGITLAEEYISRDTPDSSKASIVPYLKNIEWHMENAVQADFSMDKPAWWGDRRIHDSHKSILLSRDESSYSQHFADIDSEPKPFFP